MHVPQFYSQWWCQEYAPRPRRTDSPNLDSAGAPDSLKRPVRLRNPNSQGPSPPTCADEDGDDAGRGF